MSPVGKPVAREWVILLVLGGVQISHILDFMILMPLGPQFMRLFAIGPTQFGFLVSIYTFSAAAVGFAAAFFIDRFDRKKALLILYACFAAPARKLHEFQFFDSAACIGHGVVRREPAHRQERCGRIDSLRHGGDFRRRRHTGEHLSRPPHPRCFGLTHGRCAPRRHGGVELQIGSVLRNDRKRRNELSDRRDRAVIGGGGPAAASVKAGLDRFEQLVARHRLGKKVRSAEFHRFGHGVAVAAPG